ncbi:MAG: hypothetical protein KatS3mg130_0214 [Candidatus Sumerlaea sp.]|nr:TlpA family protein disulfide reductase [Candidatus Sumerlaea chitinivorans]GIX43806.1 MAG: hypothetical protein KatS3mg130_0214 [Candidatus Sumerlaea sp.]
MARQSVSKIAVFRPPHPPKVPDYVGGQRKSSCWQWIPITLVLVLGAQMAMALPEVKPLLGEPAPPLQGLLWIKGTPVDLAANRGTTVTVVEFWATWCGPCVESIPHLTELQKRFGPRGLAIVGISDEGPSTVREFVEKMGQKMDYSVAVDPTGDTKSAYMDTYGQRGIPCAFVVDRQGRIVWIGHPQSELEKTLEEILSGRYDLAVANEQYVHERLSMYFRNQLSRRDLDSQSMVELERETEEFLARICETTPTKKRDGRLWLFAYAINESRVKNPKIRALAVRAMDQRESHDYRNVMITHVYVKALQRAGQTTQALEVAARGYRENPGHSGFGLLYADMLEVTGQLAAANDVRAKLPPPEEETDAPPRKPSETATTSTLSSERGTSTPR